MRHIGVRLGNAYHIKDDHAIMLICSKTHGTKEIIIDLDDIERCQKYTWGIYRASNTNNFYASTHFRKPKGRLELHRFITNCPKEKIVDHINHNGLDNRKNNLRICGFLTNNLNKKGAAKNNHLGVRNVRYSNKLRKYLVRFKQKHIGCYETLEEAKEVAKRLQQENLAASL